MDALSSVLAAIHIDGSLLAYFRNAGDWGIDLAAADGFAQNDAVPFHYVVEGVCWLLGESEPRLLSAGDLVFLPGWSTHALASHPKTATVTVYEMLDRFNYPRWRPGTTMERPLTFLSEQGGRNPVTILSGLFSLSGPGSARLLDPMPRFLILNADDPSFSPQIRNILDFVLSESIEPMPGYVAVASRLMDLLFIQLLRIIRLRFPLQPGLLNGISHPRMAPILAAIHSDPGYAWTLDRLAEAGDFSRTTLVKIFHELVGTTPMAYLTEWRMHLAQSALMTNDRSVTEIAKAVGYPVSQCFSRAFKKATGLSPVSYRKRRLEARR